MEAVDGAQGPLFGLRVVELGGIGPGPFAAMHLADLGADVVRIDRVGAPTPTARDRDSLVLHRSRRSVGLDLKDPDGMETVLALAAVADVLLEGFRPGVVELLGVGPDVCWARNPRLVYGHDRLGTGRAIRRRRRP